MSNESSFIEAAALMVGTSQGSVLNSTLEEKRDRVAWSLKSSQ
jgi:hypothetical protein